MAGRRRDTPEGFTEDMAELVALEAERDKIQARIDDLFLSLLVDRRAPSTTMAERLGITVQAVSSRRNGAMQRRSRRTPTQAV